MKTKTIKERAKEFAMNKSDMYCGNCDTCSTKCEDYREYVDIATKQKAIDNAELLKLKSVWEKQAQINHDDVANYKQGYHDAIEKACEYLDNYFMEIGYPDDWMRDSPNMLSGEERFRKAMEE